MGSGESDAGDKWVLERGCGGTETVMAGREESQGNAVERVSVGVSIDGWLKEVGW